MNVTTVTAKSPGRPKDAAKGQAILMAARALFLSLGYQGTSMEAVAAAAGVSKLTVYSHFKGKEELFAAAIADVCKSQLPDQLFVLDAHRSFAEHLLSVGQAIYKLTNSKESIALYRLLMSLSEQDAALVQTFYEAGPAKVLKALEALFSEAQARSCLALESPLRAAQHFLNLLNGSAHFHLTLGCNPSLPLPAADVHVREVVALFLRAYAAD